MLKYYIMNEVTKEPKEIADLLEWAESAKGVSRVASDLIGDVHVSTVFIGIDDLITERPYFETMIFGGPLDMYQERCSTWDEAVVQHAEAVRLHKESLDQRRIKDAD